MKKSAQSSVATIEPVETHAHGNGGNGAAAAVAESPADLSIVLAALQTMRNGDFSVRLPGSWTGLSGKIADTFNDIVAANQQMAQELNRVGQVVGKEGRTRERLKFHEARGAWDRWKLRSIPWLRICCAQRLK